ncbi:MAG TPA: CGNR zinc finger domain-containing protein, partial [Phycicoccus sp.]
MTLMHAAALTNTGPALGAEDREDLPDLASLVAWMDRWEWTGARPTTEEDVDAVRRLRPRLRAIWGLDEDGLVEAANTLLEEGHALPRLVRHGAFGWHVHATSDEAPLAQRVAVEVGMALVDVIRAGETERLKVCAGEDCEDLLVDLSRNRSR